MLQHITIDTNSANQRFDRFLRKYCKPYPDITLADIYKRIRKGAIRLNGHKAKQQTMIQLDDSITFHLTDKDQTKFLTTKRQKKAHLTIDQIQPLIIYQDTHRIARNKPPHIPMHGGTKNTITLSLHDYLQAYVQKTKTTDHDIATTTFTPNFCHRLDKNTSGVVIAASTYSALQLLNQLIRDRQVHKTYTTIVLGHTPPQGVINTPLFKGYNKKTGRAQSFINQTKGLPAHTEFTTVAQQRHPTLGPLSLLTVEIKTGRMHQIRTHLASIGHPVLGDLAYGNPGTNRLLHKHTKINRQLLHATTYSFFDNLQNRQLTITAPLHEDFFLLFSK